MYLKKKKPYQLAVVTSHPVQYQAPLFEVLEQQPSIELTVYFGSDASLQGAIDPGFGIPVTWDRPLIDGYRSVFLHSGEASFSKGGIKGFARLLLDFQQKNYDAVWINGYASALSIEAYVAAWLSGTPVLLRTEAELLQPRPAHRALAKKLLLGLLFKATAGFLTIGTANRAFYMHYGIQEKKMFHTPYSVDNVFFDEQYGKLLPHRITLRQELGFENEQTVITYAGKLVDRKRPFDLLRAYHNMISDSFKVGLLLVGDGPLRGELEQYVREHKLENVCIVGFKNQTEIPRYYICGDIFVLPSCTEPWGLVVNEAMLFGMPAIASDRVGSSLDLIETGITGYTYPVGDVKFLASAIALLVQDSQLRSEMGKAARARVLDWNYRTCVEGILQALGGKGI